MKKVLVCALLVFAFAGAAFAAVGGHVDQQVTAPFVPAPAAVVEAVSGEAFTEVAPAVSLTAQELVSLNFEVAVAVNLPKVKAGKAGVNVFGFAVTKDSPYETSAYQLFFKVSGALKAYADLNAADVQSAAVEVETYKYLDAEGKEFTGAPKAGDTVYLAVNVPAAGEYEPVLIAKKQGGGDGGGGCDAGFSAAALAALGALFILKKRG